jgi:hypothetical protein
LPSQESDIRRFVKPFPIWRFTASILCCSADSLQPIQQR